MRRTTALVVAATTLAWCAACADQPAEPTLPDPLPTDVPYAYQPSLSSPEETGLLVGTLELQDGCLVIIPEGGGDPVVPVLPIAATEWDGTTLTVNDIPADLGDSTMLPGGGKTEATDDWFLPESCPVSDAGEVDPYFLVNLETGEMG